MDEDRTKKKGIPEEKDERDGECAGNSL